METFQRPWSTQPIDAKHGRGEGTEEIQLPADTCKLMVRRAGRHVEGKG